MAEKNDDLVDYVECDGCYWRLIDGEYAYISGDGHVFCCLQCALDFYGIRDILLKKPSETQLNWKRCKRSELIEEESDDEDT